MEHERRNASVSRGGRSAIVDSQVGDLGLSTVDVPPRTPPGGIFNGTFLCLNHSDGI